MALSEGQALVAQDQHRFRTVIAGRRWGKTWLSIRELARFAHQPRRRCYYIAPTYRMARQIVWDELKYRLMDLRWVSRVNETDLTLRLINGSTISLRGADNPDSLRGVGLDFVVLDEFAWIDSTAWSEVLRPTLSDRGGHAMFISTPIGRNNWAYDMFCMPRTNSDWASWQFTSLSGGRISAEEIASARRDLDLRTFRQEYEATFETNVGRIYYGFEDANIQTWPRPAVLDPAWQRQEILVFCDFNISPITAAVAIQTQMGLHIIDEIVMFSSNTDELAQEIRTRYPQQPITAFPDPAGAQRKTSAGGRTDISILMNAGFQVRYHRAHPPVRDRINAVNSAFCTAQGQRRLLIDPACRRCIESFERHTYREGTQVPDKDSGWDHMTDAVGYGVEYLMPVKKDTDFTAPRRWTQAIA